MFVISNPQKRERLLIVAAGFILLLILAVVMPGQLKAIATSKITRDKLQKQIDDHERIVKDKANIQSRLAAMSEQALAFGNSEAVTRYQNWLRDLAISAGLQPQTIVTGNPTTSGANNPKALYAKHTFPISGTGNLAQIAEFLRRFHRTEYLHAIQSVQPRPAGANQPGLFNVTFRVEVLSLPQVRDIHIPIVDNPAYINDEQQMLADIQSRNVLSAYVPPRLAPTRERPPLTVFNATHETVTLRWQPINEASNYEIRYKRMADADQTRNWQIVPFEGTVGTVENLFPETDYEFQVRAAAAPGVRATAWTPTPSVTTMTWAEPPPQEPILPPFNDIRYCFLTSITVVDGKPQCWIDHRPTGTKYYLLEGGSFLLGDYRCVIEKIDISVQRIQVDLEGAKYTLEVGQNFDQVERVVIVPEPEVVAPEPEA